MDFSSVTRSNFAGLLYCISGFAGLAYETVWIRSFSLSFGNTLLAFSTVISVYLGGLALGSALGSKLSGGRGLFLYGASEVWIGFYALAIPRLLAKLPALVSPFYGSGPAITVNLLRALLGALVLLPATLPMGAGLPWLGDWLRGEGKRPAAMVWIYALNTVGGAAGAVVTGLVLLPAGGYQSALLIASGLDIAAGSAALWLAGGPERKSESPAENRLARGVQGLSIRFLMTVAVLSGWSVMLYEVALGRTAGLMFGPTAATLTLTLGVVLLGLAAGALLASAIRRNLQVWIAGSQLTLAALLLCASLTIAASPAWLANQIGLRSGDAAQTELLEAGVLMVLLFPLMASAGMALPLAMSGLEAAVQSAAGGIGKLYAWNTAGCIAGALMAGWVLIPRLGLERTLYAGALANAALALRLLTGGRLWRPRAIPAVLVTAAAIACLVFPRWDMAAMTAGSYKYAAYYSADAAGELHKGEMKYLREGTAGVVTVRSEGNTRVLAIDGKVDATDAGGDLLTEKLLAHLPLQMVNHVDKVCVIGLASGVTAGAALTYPLTRLDVIELSNEVVQASHFFDAVNGRPLDSPRTHLIVNDGRNHLALTAERYDAILSEPSNPWISGMNSLFTREFFQIARGRLRAGGVLAQWFHLYNMPADDLRSLLRSFTEVFPSASLWQLNEGDVLLTGFADDRAPDVWQSSLPAAALADLASAGVSDPELLAGFYIIRGEDLVRFAGRAAPNTDDWPVLEFHGQRDLLLQTDMENMRELASFPKTAGAPPGVQAARGRMTQDRWVARGRMFERAESFRMAFDSYRTAAAMHPGDPGPLAGMLRSARSDDERSIAGTLDSRTEEALAAVRNGKPEHAELMLRTLVLAFPDRPEPNFNYGLFCLEGSRYEDALRSFQAAIAAAPAFLPAYEAIAETYLRKHDTADAAAWSRRILQIDPGHKTAAETLARIAAGSVKR